MERHTRRAFLIAATSGGAVVTAGCMRRGSKPEGTMERHGDEDVAPAEDLMREHGVLERILLVYEEAGRRIETHEAPPADVVTGAAGIVRRFIEDYHEKLEEDHLFPRFEQAKRLDDLVAVLRAQHVEGRRVTDDILRNVQPGARASSREALRRSLDQFVRMYRPHAAREDTVLFPAFHELLGSKEYESLGDVFEAREHRLFGARGFEGVVDEVAQLERALGIYDLAGFTPR